MTFMGRSHESFYFSYTVFVNTEPIPAEYWVTLYPDNYVSDSGNINISSCGQYYTQILIQRVQAAGSNVSDDLSKLYDDLDVTLTPVIDSAQAFKITQTNETEVCLNNIYIIILFIIL